MPRGDVILIHNRISGKRRALRENRSRLPRRDPLENVGRNLARYHADGRRPIRHVAPRRRRRGNFASFLLGCCAFPLLKFALALPFKCLFLFGGAFDNADATTLPT
jgi:hypothetical protein